MCFTKPKILIIWPYTEKARHTKEEDECQADRESVFKELAAILSLVI